MLPWSYIVVEGVIGAGKTSLTKLLASHFQAKVNLEVVEENPFLSNFYQDRSSYAFQTQIFFLLSRFRQQQQLKQPDLFSDILVSDYLFAKDRIFANLNLNDDELLLYDQLANLMEQRILKPDLVVYLQASTEVLMDRISVRGRSFERDMSFEYIDALNSAYSYFSTTTARRRCWWSTPTVRFRERPGDLSQLTSLLQEEFQGTRFFAPA